MARTKSLESIEAKIIQAQETVTKAKAKYQRSIAELEALIADKDKLLERDLLKAYKQSGKSYEVVIRYLKEGVRQ